MLAIRSNQDMTKYSQIY